MNGQFLHHEPCPKCRDIGQDRAGNNLGVWDDHKYCFACGYFESNDNSLNLNRFVDNKKKSSDINTICLPDDCSAVLPERVVNWLDKYGLTSEEKVPFIWSEEHERLIYPVYDTTGSVTYYQGRKFPTNQYKYSKYHTQGQSLDIFHVLGPEDTRIIVVEDVISAIKVGRQAQVMPLWGSNIPLQRITRLSSMFFKLWIWLDMDKAAQSLKTRQLALPYFDEVRCIITDKDPKCYSDDEIKEILNK